MSIRSSSRLFWHDEQERDKSLLLLDVARQYFEQGLGQAEIAKAHGYSRATISRLLAEARETGVVTISISSSLERLAGLEELISSRYGVGNVRVTPLGARGEGVESVGVALARFLRRVIKPGMSIGFTTGRVHQVALQHLGHTTDTNVKVVQMVGRSGMRGRMVDTAGMCRQVAEAFGGVAHTFDAPLIASSSQMAADIRLNRQVSKVLKESSQVDLAVIGIGANFRQPADVFSDKLTLEIVRTLHDHGAVGHVVGRFIDYQGRPVRNALNDMVVGISLAKLRQVPQVLGVAAGSQKAQAIAAALRGGLINSLLLDVGAAQALAYLPEKKPLSKEPLWTIDERLLDSSD